MLCFLKGKVFLSIYGIQLGVWFVVWLVGGRMGEESLLVDTSTKQTFSLQDLEYIGRLIQVKGVACLNCVFYAVQVSDVSLQESNRLLVIPPLVQEAYCVKIIDGKPPCLKGISGICSVDGRSLAHTSLLLSPG